MVSDTGDARPSAPSSGRAVDETELIAGVLAGNRQAGRALYDAHAPAVYRLVYRMVSDPDLAQEFTQYTFIKVFARLDTFRGDAALRTWIHSVAVSCVLNGMRKVKRWRERERPLDGVLATPATGPRPVEPDLRERLRTAIEELPLKLRTPLVLHDVEGYSHPEIAEMTGVPEGTCKTRLAGARARLRESLAAFAPET